MISSTGHRHMAIHVAIQIPQIPSQIFMMEHCCVWLTWKTVVMHHIQCMVIGTILVDKLQFLLLVLIILLPMVQLHFYQIEVQMKSEMGGSFMALFVSFVDGVVHLKEVVSAVRYPVLLIPVLTEYSM